MFRKATTIQILLSRIRKRTDSCENVYNVSNHQSTEKTIIFLKLERCATNQWFSAGVDFAPESLFGNVCKHFWGHTWGRGLLLAYSG